MIRRIPSSTRSWTGGMPIVAPVAFVACIVAMLLVAEHTTRPAAVFVVLGWVALLASRRATVSYLLGLVVLTGVCATGLTVAGRSEPWALATLVPGVLAASGVVALTRRQEA
ncbi:hypothetical protein [Aeromicrobium sp. Leaf350]|uniref:hypothetical protein n=1 Tax=Aeromicrobium sp. Leaf350 TaxID=2876565 RepID=UPI001E3F0428|nr:hypothetical protein [Aeromicrobium sp. Leaf350]